MQVSVCVCVCVCVYVRVCAYVCEKERLRENVCVCVRSGVCVYSWDYFLFCLNLRFF